MKKINLFITGLGNVGSELLSIIENNSFKSSSIVNVVAISNSKYMFFNKNGIDLSDWKKLLLNGEKNNRESFFEKTKKLSLKNSVFVDNTASNTIANEYENYLSKGISVVTCNKIACSSKLNVYEKLVKLSIQNNVSFLYETNVGSSLPVLETLKNLLSAGAKIDSVKGILSGSLNYIFNNFLVENSFHEIVNKARELGLTEPNPKVDLSGEDVARKLLIISRECGYKTEIGDMKIKSFLPEDECISNNSYESFYECIKKNKNYFNKKLNIAKSRNCKLKHIAELKQDGTGLISLQEIKKGNFFYNVNDEDNLIMISPKNSKKPILIKGPGAGGYTTANGVLNDILKI